MFDFLSGSTNRTQTTRLLLLAILVLTVPCYCLGAVMLAYAPEQEQDTTAIPTNATLGAMSQTPRFTPTITPFATWTATIPGSGLQATPGQLYLPTNTPFLLPATATFFPTLFSSPTLPPVASLTLAPTLTLMPTNPPPPTNTEPPPPTVPPPPTATEVPPPTAPPPPTDEPPPTQEVLEATPESGGGTN